MNEFMLAGIILIVTFLTTLILTKLWIRVAKKSGLVGTDLNKINKPKIPESGGIAVILSFSFGILLYVFLKTFYLETATHMIEIFAVLVSILLAGILGFVDDILGWKVGLKQWQKPLLTLPIAIPLMAISAGHSIMSIPIIGTVNFGLIYPLVIIPLGIIGAANGFNMIAGMNGLEAGMGTIILGTLGFVSYFTQSYWVSLICFLMTSSLIGFLLFNKYPAKIFPGDTLTYSIGALIAVVAILGNMERLALILFIPYFIEFFLKLRSKFKAESFGKPQKDGTLKPGYKKCYSLTHITMKYLPKIIKRNAKEREVVATIIFIEIIFMIFGLVSTGVI